MVLLWTIVMTAGTKGDKKVAKELSSTTIRSENLGLCPEYNLKSDATCGDSKSAMLQCHNKQK